MRSEALQSLHQLQLYLESQASSTMRYFCEQTLLEIFGWIPMVPGIVLRAILYRLILEMKGFAAIEKGVRIRFANNIHLEQGAYVDQGVYLHACPRGIRIGRNSLVMHGSILHVYNFRGIPHSGIRIGNDSLIGENNVIRGQGGVDIGNRVYTSPMVQLLAVNHKFEDRARPFRDQGITAEGIIVHDDVWIGAGAIILDGVEIGAGSVVAAGSVVTRDVAPHSLVAGVPARIVREIGASRQSGLSTEVFI
jgi:acetyltransferase-like isoleucine patch superfamily enzyme